MAAMAKDFPKKKQVVNNFKYRETISKNSPGIRKLLGDIDGEQAIVTIKMPSFNHNDNQETELLQLLRHGDFGEVLLSNEEYEMYHVGSTGTTSSFKFVVEVICPATEFHIEKHRDKEIVLVRETAEMYRDMTTIFIENHKDEHREQIQWLLNILNGTSEQDSIFFRNTDQADGFVLLPNMHWRSGNTASPAIDSLDCLAIVNTMGLRTIRDLTGTHLPLLRNLKNEGTAAIAEKYGVAENKLRIYFHYLPSFYHLHVHYTHVNNTCGCNIERAIFLDDVIDMLETSSNAMEEKTMTFGLSTNHTLYGYVKTYTNLPSPLKRMSKGIKHAKDSLKLDRMKNLKKRDGNADGDKAWKKSSLGAAVSSSADNDVQKKTTLLPSSMNTEDIKKVLPKHLRGIGGKIRNATDSLKLNKTNSVKRRPGADSIFQTDSSNNRKSKIINSTDSLKLPRNKDIKRLHADEIFKK